ncbi:hypothetical protein [Delftia acidovorans]|uniref:hypothetical protein n=1 Tax=Delftia acidovorans TaxID=80866 RepID=UPI00034E0C9E|nr:hypothetical protein [Delftia acidovorans]EPD35468.1 hypothetical protein HMPREF9702_05957 [Delftia acidovorans CCUG 15835]
MHVTVNMPSPAWYGAFIGDFRDLCARHGLEVEQLEDSFAWRQFPDQVQACRLEDPPETFRSVRADFSLRGVLKKGEKAAQPTQAAPSIAPATQDLHRALIRLAKGALTAWEKWLESRASR